MRVRLIAIAENSSDLKGLPAGVCCVLTDEYEEWIVVGTWNGQKFRKYSKGGMFLSQAAAIKRASKSASNWVSDIQHPGDSL